MSLMKLQTFGKKHTFNMLIRDYFKHCWLLWRSLIDSFPTWTKEDFCNCNHVQLFSRLTMCCLATCSLWCENTELLWVGCPWLPWVNNGEMEVDGFECKTWTSSYGTWHQRLWRLRRDPGLDITVKNGIGDQLTEKGVTSQKGIIPCRTEMNWN